MPVIYFNGDATREQAKGGTLYNGVTRLYAIRRDDPLNMIFLGGHRIEDAPTYNITEGTIIPRYVVRNGRNVVVEEQISEDIVKGVSFNIMLPNQSIPAAMRIYQTQKVCKYDLLIVPEDCGSGCDKWFWVGEDLKLGAVQITNAAVGFDDSESAITRISVAKTSGQLLQYNGLEYKLLTPANVPLESVLLVDEGVEDCPECGCPYQQIWVGGVNGVDASVNGGGTWTAQDIATNAPNGGTFTSLEYVGGRVVAGDTDTPNAQGGGGGLGYFVGDISDPAVYTPANLFDADGVALATNPSIQDVIVIGANVWAFGGDGDAGGAVSFIAKSCDGGLNYTQQPIDTAVVTEEITSADYDADSGLIILGTVAGNVFALDPISLALNDISADVGVVGAVILSVENTGANQFAIGTATGLLIENFDVSGDVTDWNQTGAFTNGVHASANDPFNYRTLVGQGTDLELRDINSQQNFEDFGLALVGNITEIREGYPLRDEGTNFFIVVTDQNEVAVASQCGICLAANC